MAWLGQDSEMQTKRRGHFKHSRVPDTVTEGVRANEVEGLSVT